MGGNIKTTMRHKPEHTCFHECPACAFELGEQTAKKRPQEHARYVWMIIGSTNPCDIRRYAFSHQEAIAQLAHASKSKFRDGTTGGVWTLFKLVRVNKKVAAQKSLAQKFIGNKENV